MSERFFDELGGEVKLRAAINEFVDRMYGDIMIGFFFVGVDRDRIKEFEYQHAARILGAEMQYRGRPLGEAHQRHPIMDGHFDRRKQLLKETLLDHAVPAAAMALLLLRTEQLRSVITGKEGRPCIAPARQPSDKENGHG